MTTDTMVRRLAAYLPLLGTVLFASPAEARACDDWFSAEPPPATGALSAAAAEDTPVLWCERADDPRCTPDSRDANAPERFSRATVRPSVPGLPGATVRPAPLASGALLGPRWGVRHRVPRPPRP